MATDKTTRLCAFPGCGRRYVARRLCDMHYRRLMTNGDPSIAQPTNLGPIKHGHAKRQTPTYMTWCGMKARCNNSKNPAYRFYGGRGIKVCDRWRKFENFLADMGERPNVELSLDRIDSNGNYEPGNCRWATIEVQKRNSSRNKPITALGMTKTLSEWARHLDVNVALLRSRLRYGWSIEDALTIPRKTVATYRGRISPVFKSTQT